MDRTADLLQAQAVGHCQRDFGNQVAGVAGDDRRADDPVATSPDMNLDEPFVPSLNYKREKGGVK